MITIGEYGHGYQPKAARGAPAATPTTGSGACREIVEHVVSWKLAEIQKSNPFLCVLWGAAKAAGAPVREIQQ